MLSCCSKNTLCSLDVRVHESSWFYFSFMFECKSSSLECEGLMHLQVLAIAVQEYSVLF